MRLMDPNSILALSIKLALFKLSRVDLRGQGSRAFFFREGTSKEIAIFREGLAGNRGILVAEKHIMFFLF